MYEFIWWYCIHLNTSKLVIHFELQMLTLTLQGHWLSLDSKFSGLWILAEIASLGMVLDGGSVRDVVGGEVQGSGSRCVWVGRRGVGVKQEEIWSLKGWRNKQYEPIFSFKHLRCQEWTNNTIWCKIGCHSSGWRSARIECVLYPEKESLLSPLPGYHRNIVSLMNWQEFLKWIIPSSIDESPNWDLEVKQTFD